MKRPYFVAILLVTRDQGGRGEGVGNPPRTDTPDPSSLAALSVADNVLYVVRQGVVSAPGDAAEGAGAGGGAAEAPAGPPKLTIERLAALTKDPLSGLAGLLASQLATSAGTAQYWSRIGRVLFQTSAVWGANTHGLPTQ